MSRRGRPRATRMPRRPHQGISPHRWKASDTPGVCVHCPLSQWNAVHDQDAIATAEAERDERQAELDRRVGDR